MQTRTSHARHLGEIEFALRELVDELDPHAVASCEASDMWRAFDRVERLAASAKILLAPRVDQAGEWQRRGHRSAAEQLAADAGTSVAAARSLLDTSERVATQPQTERALRAGELSPAKAELVAGAIEVAPEAADRLLALAKTAPLAKLKEEALRTKAAVDADETYRRIRRERCARTYTDAEGAWHLHARGPVDDGGEFVRMFEPLVDQLFKAAYREGRREPRDAYAFDALIELANRADQPTDTEPADHTTTKKSKAPQLLGLVRADHAALVRGHVEGDEVCEIAGLGPIPVRIARDLLGDAVVKLVLTKGVDVANITHLGRGPTVAQKIALWWRTPQCTESDCTRVQRIQFDHREEWRTTHHTRLDEGDGLCGHHHDLKTYLGWALVAGTGQRPMVPPDDPRHPKNKPKQ
jgi:hypothetical protein